MSKKGKVQCTVDSKVFKCGTCKKYLSNPPVYVLHSGENACEKCSTGTPYFRNKIYEEMVKDSLFPCNYASQGCPETVEFNNNGVHESVCAYKHYSCPVELCLWSGKLVLFPEHFQKHHAAEVLLEPKFAFDEGSEVFKLFYFRQRSFVAWINAKEQQKISIELINLDFCGNVEYKVCVCKPDETELWKKSKSRSFTGRMREVVDFDKKVVRELLGHSETWDCRFQLLLCDQNQSIPGPA